MRRPAVHLDATRAGDAVRMAFCGWAAVETDVDVSRVTCKTCLAKLADERGRKRGGRHIATAELGRHLASSVAAALAPCAGPPPVLTGPRWSTVCPASGPRCGTCAVCEWEHEANKWHSVEMYTRRHALKREASAPRWRSVDAALVAYAEHEAHDRWGPSAMGPILDRAARGDIGESGGPARSGDRLLDRAAEVVPVELALAVAYPEGAHVVLSAAACRAVLLARTPGVLTGPPPAYEVLASGLEVTVGDLRALVRSGRRTVAVELAARGLVPSPRPSLGLAERVEAARGRYHVVE